MTQEEFNQLMQSKEEFKVILYTNSSAVGLCYKFDTFGELVDLIKNQNEEKPNYCHHEVDLSSCSEEYRKAYYDGWNNCNMQHSQCELEKSDVLKCLINGMKFYYENNEEATWGTLKFSMKVKDILFWLEKQGEQKSLNDVAKEITKNKETVTSFLKSCGIMNANGELADEYKIEQDEQKLVESEDEKVRKAIISGMTALKNQGRATFANVLINDCISWLEKQGDKCLVNFDEAEQEKYDFVSGRFIECRKSFNEFKEDNSYWLEYIGDDTYVGRSDNILNKKFHITPGQLFTLFTWQHRPKEDSNVNEETNAPTEYGKYVDECLNEASKHFFSDGEDAYSVADLFYAGVKCGTSWFKKQAKQEKDILEDAILDGNEDGLIAETIRYKKEKQSEQKSAWSEEDEKILNGIIEAGEHHCQLNIEETNWLKSLRPQNNWKPSDEQMEALKAMARYCEIATSFDAYKQRVVESLYSELKKLKEE